MHRFKLLIKLSLKGIDKAGGEEMNEIIRTLILRHGKIYPDYELIVMSLPKYDWYVREYQLDRTVELLRKQAYAKV